jgi:hypothetical protein
MWTVDEQIQIAQQLTALHDAIAAMEYLSRHLNVYPEDVARIEEIMRFFCPIWENHCGGVLYLLDLEGAMSDTIGAMTRSQARDAGIALLARGTYAPALTRLERLQQAYPDSKDLAQALKFVMQADGWRVAFDTSLDYAEPRPAENLLLPGQDRRHTPMVGPHGDYRRFGELWRSGVRSLCKGWLAEIKAAMLFAPYIQGAYLRTNINNMGRIGRYMVQALGLAVSIEHPDLVDLIDASYAAGTLGRPPQFFQVLLLVEILINSDHLPEGSGDYRTLPALGNRKVVRGASYDLLKWNNNTALYKQQTTLPIEVAKTLDEALYWVGVLWKEIDTCAWNCMVLRDFLNTGRVYRLYPPS